MSMRKLLSSDSLNFLLFAVVSLFLRGLLVQLTYNSVVPKLAGTSVQTFRELTLMDAVVLVILVQNLIK